MKQDLKKIFTNKLTLLDALTLELEVQKICTEMSENGFYLDIQECAKQIEQIQERIDWADDIVNKVVPKKLKKYGTTVTKLYKMNGDYTKQVQDWIDGEEIDVVGPFDRLVPADFNLNSSSQVSEFLLKNGWNPTTWNFKKLKNGKYAKDQFGARIKTTPKLTEDSLDSLKGLGKEAELIMYRRKLTHKRNQIQGFLKKCRQDYTIPSIVNTIGAATGRMTHSVVVNVPSDKPGSIWRPMRKVMSAKKGYKVVGCDADQCQVRGLAHYMNDESFTKALETGNKADGTDIHSINGKIAGVTRNESKAVLYGFLFGATEHKTAEQLGCTVNKAKTIRNKIAKGMGGFQELIKELTEYWKTYGYVIGIDGRKVMIPEEHEVLVYLLQNFEAVLMKWALVLATREIKKRKIKAKLATIQHDEFQFICKEEQAEELASILEESLTKAGTIIGARCTIKGEAVIGNNWYETH